MMLNTSLSKNSMSFFKKSDAVKHYHIQVVGAQGQHMMCSLVTNLYTYLNDLRIIY